MCSVWNGPTLYSLARLLNPYRSPPTQSSSTANYSQDQHWAAAAAEMVENKAKRGPLLTLSVVMLIIVLNLDHCEAATSLKGNATSTFDDPVEESEFIFDDPVEESEFIFDSEISRMLIDYKHITDSSRDRNAALCSRVKPYKTCFPQRNGQPVGETCDPYKRRGCN